MNHQKLHLLEKLRKKMLKADLPLKETAINLVFGEGSSDPKVFFIGEAPGRFEDEQGRPFVGSAGKYLEAMLRSIGLDRQCVFITSIVKYRPPKNRPPTFEEIKAHTPYLVEKIRIIKPKLIVTLGNFATRFVLSGFDIHQMDKVPGIAQLHGKPVTVHFEGADYTVIPVYHPAAVIYKRTLLKTLEQDFQKIKQQVAST